VLLGEAHGSGPVFNLAAKVSTWRCVVRSGQSCGAGSVELRFAYRSPCDIIAPLRWQPFMVDL
jgi:hypothetical protein